MLGVILHAYARRTELFGRWAEGQWTQPILRTGQHNETTFHTIRYSPQLSTCQTITLTSTRGNSTTECIQYVHNIRSIHPYSNIHIYCRFICSHKYTQLAWETISSNRFYCKHKYFNILTILWNCNFNSCNLRIYVT